MIMPRPNWRKNRPDRGVSDVTVGGSSLPAVRVELNPSALFNQGVSLDAVRQTISAANVRRPQGSVDAAETHWQVQANDEIKPPRATAR